MKQSIATAATILLFFAAQANAQIKQGQQDVGIDVGAVIPLSNISVGGGSAGSASGTLGKPGLGFGVSYDYMLLKNVSVGGDLNYQMVGSKVLDFSGGGSARFVPSVLTILATSKYQFMPENRVRPFALAGIGYGGASVKFEPNNSSLGGSSTATGSGFAYAVGGGVDYDINERWSAGAQLRFTGITASLNQNLGSQAMNSLDILFSAHYKFGV